MHLSVSAQLMIMTAVCVCVCFFKFKCLCAPVCTRATSWPAIADAVLCACVIWYTYLPNTLKHFQASRQMTDNQAAAAVTLIYCSMKPLLLWPLLCHCLLTVWVLGIRDSNNPPMCCFVLFCVVLFPAWSKIPGRSCKCIYDVATRIIFNFF